MKKIIVSILLCMLLISSLHNVQAGTKLNKTECTIYVGDSIKLKLSGTKKPLWQSSDTKVATVSKNGTVKAKDPGNVTITATSSKSSKKYTCKIKVKDKLLVSTKTVTCYLKESEKISASLVKPQADECISFDQEADGIVKADFSEKYTDQGDPIIKIDPVKTGCTEIKVIASYDNGKNNKILQTKSVKVQVFRDRSGWISEDDLFNFYVYTQTSDQGVILCKAKDSGQPEEYNIDHIRTKVVKSTVYYNIADLESQKII